MPERKFKISFFRDWRSLTPSKARASKLPPGTRNISTLVGKIGPSLDREVSPNNKFFLELRCAYSAALFEAGCYSVSNELFFNSVDKIFSVGLPVTTKGPECSGYALVTEVTDDETQ